ncbi:helix-turn-helix domain-containing protein [Alteromonas sp. 009811495]|jgi:DNA-binding Xre family transcriptional regulator|uniref:helix-turn-helix domain-containing protein n=1 Tax=Alteromonas sp. 009811495 TaxID=3002962 RepID=UPI00237D5A00|nr:helix-turn-helix transcriptional regulator [Alteromonas sp. 009811495]WDT85533.1 helix-turn-helix transcriptional regulator [Alteromonas sp. 009811495]
MSQINLIYDTLKQCLREQRITYKQLAQTLNVSEASVKRNFSLQAFTLEKLEQICECLHLSLSELFQLSQKQQEKISQLSEEQELKLLANPKLLLAAVCVRDGWRFDEIISHYNIEKVEGIKLMTTLDKLKLIELLPNNRYKLLIAQDFRWIPGGPLAKFMENEVMVKFMAPKKNEPWMFRSYLRGRYSPSSVAIIQRRLEQLRQEAAKLSSEDNALPIEERQHIGLLMAMRPWEPSLFENMRRS